MIDWAALVVPTSCELNVTLVGVTVAAGAAPVPVNGTVCGLSAASSAIARLAVRLPEADGENETEIVQVAFAASVAGLVGQVFVCA